MADRFFESAQAMTSLSNLMPVTPVSPPAAYLGGKRALSKTLVPMINAVPHTGYAEPFVGMGGVFFKRDMQPKTEVINDINGELVNLFRQLQRHYPQLMDTMKFQITSRREFERLSATDPSSLTELERAARFIYLQKTAFGGKVSGQNFGVSKTRGANFNLTRLAPILEEVHERLAGVVFENMPWSAFIERYDHEGMLFYLDPPYWDNEADYGKGIFSKDDFASMADQLANIKGTFILSINDKPQVRQTFKRFNLMPVGLNYTISSKGSTDAKELIITP